MAYILSNVQEIVVNGQF